MFYLTSVFKIHYILTFTEGEMKTFDFENTDDDTPGPGRDRNDPENEVQKLIERLKQGSSGSSTAEALEEIVNYYCEAERYQDALPFVNLLLEQVTYSAEAWQKKGIILNPLQRFEEALDCLDKPLALNPADQELLRAAPANESRPGGAVAFGPGLTLEALEFTYMPRGNSIHANMTACGEASLLSAI